MKNYVLDINKTNYIFFITYEHRPVFFQTRLKVIKIFQRSNIEKLVLMIHKHLNIFPVL